jgi:hypothetical protein
MAELSEKKKGIEELLEKIPPEKRWEITSKILSSIVVMRGEKIIAPALGKGKGITSPIWGAEKWTEINVKIFGDTGKITFPWIKETFNIPVEDAIEAAKLETVVATLLLGPEQENEYPEATPERVVLRITRCTWMERYKEFEVDPAYIPCFHGCQAWCEEGHKAINPKITFKRTKSMPRGDPYCEGIIEFEEE